jgi:16S rRNA (cytosine967-C5)-methyltransferase
VSTPINERELALDGLLEITENKTFSNLAINQLLSKHQDLDKRSRAFVSRVIVGTLEHLIEIDYIINQFSTVKIKKMKPIIRNILRAGVYQLKYMDNIPQSAVCNEAVKLASKRGFKNLKGFVNGNLRNIARNIENITYPTERLAFLEVKYSIPAWILRTWLEEFGSSNLGGDDGFCVVETIAKSFLEKRPLTIRTNLSKISPDALKSNLEKQGVIVEDHPYLDYAFKISGIDYLEGLDDFSQGNFYVQDVSSMLVGELANPKKNSVVIDLCAAPGGKTLHLADKMLINNRDNVTESQEEGYLGQILAYDLTDRKVALIQENIKRANFRNIEVLKRDATVFNEELVGKGDIVIADLPCSGLGILGKKPDLRYNASLENIQELVELQRKILTNACAYVKPQGTLIFSTCTISSKENIENTLWLLDNFSDFQLVPIKGVLAQKVREDLSQENTYYGADSITFDGIKGSTLQLLPGLNDSDGFFIAKFIKVSPNNGD